MSDSIIYWENNKVLHFPEQISHCEVILIKSPLNQ